jgi:hypothetical protein
MTTQNTELSPLEAVQQENIEIQRQIIETLNEAIAKLNETIATYESIDPLYGLKETCEELDEDPEALTIPDGFEKDGRQWYTARQYLEIMQEEFIDTKIPSQKRLFFKFTGLVSHYYQIYSIGGQTQIYMGTGAPVNVYSRHDFPLLAMAWTQAKHEMGDEKAKTIKAKYKR